MLDLEKKDVTNNLFCRGLAVFIGNLVVQIYQMLTSLMMILTHFLVLSIKNLFKRLLLKKLFWNLQASATDFFLWKFQTFWNSCSKKTLRQLLICFLFYYVPLMYSVIFTYLLFVKIQSNFIKTCFTRQMLFISFMINIWTKVPY